MGRDLKPVQHPAGPLAETREHTRGRATETVGQLRLLQPQTRTLDGTLHELFTPLYPAMPANNVQPAPFAAAARAAPRFLLLSISTAFVESTVNLVISRRFAKKQQMQWSKVGTHRLLQTRTKTLDGTLRELFIRWYPDMAVNDNQVPALARAA